MFVCVCVCVLQLTRYRVYRQPLFLQWLEVHPLFSSHSPKYCFTIVERNGLHQLVVIYTFQTATIEDRVMNELCLLLLLLCVHRINGSLLYRQHSTVSAKVTDYTSFGVIRYAHFFYCVNNIIFCARCVRDYM